MRSPLDDGPLILLDTVDSTQRYAADMLRRGESVGAVMALEQTAGRGRFDRMWQSPAGECLAVSMAIREAVGHPKPYLVGMAVAVAAAEAYDCKVRWPNDLVIRGKKLGGILTELVPDSNGAQVPVVGVGINLGQAAFPDSLADIATSLALEGPATLTPDAALRALLAAVARLPLPTAWSDLRERWMARDDSPGKRYRLHSGEEVVASSIGPEGQLIGGSREILAAEALFGS